MNTISVEVAKAKIAELGSYSRAIGWDWEYSEACKLALLCLDACKHKLEDFSYDVTEILHANSVIEAENS